MKRKRVDLIDSSTGELMGVEYLKEGQEVKLTIIDPNRSKTFKQRQVAYSLINKDFISIIYKLHSPIFSDIEHIHIVRFILLATYLNFNNELQHKGKPITKSTLAEIWETNRTRTNETYKVLIDNNYINEVGGSIMINNELLRKGEIAEYIRQLKKLDKDYTFTKLYCKNIQEIYYDADPKCRKQLAYLFQLLPYINYNFNCFCANPTEDDITKVIPYSWKDLARICGLNETNGTRVKNALYKLRVNGNHVVGQFEVDGNKKLILVNPAVYCTNNTTNMVFMSGLVDMFDLVSNSKGK